MIEKAVKSCLETEKQLKDQMATLKKNRDNVPLDVLKTKYKKGYTALCEDLRLLTSDFIKSIVLQDILHEAYRTLHCSGMPEGALSAAILLKPGNQSVL